MEQKTYSIADWEDLYGIVKQVKETEVYHTAKSILLQIFVGISDPVQTRKMLALLEQEIPKASIVGMTACSSVVQGKMHINMLDFSFFFFEESDIEVVAYDCSETDPVLAGQDIVKHIENKEHPVGLQVMATTSNLAIDGFLNKIMEQDDSITIFGGGAGVLTEEYAGIMAENMSTEKSRNHIYTQDNLYVFGKEIYQKGIIATIFSGKKLQIQAGYSLGWHAIGKEMEVTRTKGNTCIAELDGQPIVSIYKKYLNVIPDKYLIRNTCEFPLVIKRKEMTIARTPSGYTEDGSIYLTSDIHKGEKVRLSYGNPAHILVESFKMCQGMADFEPQGLTAWICGNRIAILKEAGKKEVSYYSKLFPHAIGAYSFAEIIQCSRGGGVLNSSIVVVGMREETVEISQKVSVISDVQLQDKEDIEIPYTNRLLTFLEAITSELEESNHKLEKMAAIDDLTGIYNRRRVESVLEYEITKRTKEGRLCVVMFDIDHFKVFNDTYGHEVGDTVLQKVAQCALSVIRKQDTLGRWGGEEFLCVLPDTGIEAGVEVAERIRRTIEQTYFSEVDFVTVSVGVTVALDEDTEEMIYQRVDRALYRAKETGRNRVIRG
ncbi:MAG: GGDEF domain-containing protein [Butyrivibrio sp.]|nr:GGDEF domain-containing protein [Butyrivibrio sp.]